MGNRSKLIKVAKEKFIAFGSKHTTMDEIAELLGISKKTIYACFSSKEELIIESIKELINEFKIDTEPILKSDKTALSKVIEIYKVIFKYVEKFKPSFIFGLKKYYPNAYDAYKEITTDVVSTDIMNLLEEAKTQGEIRSDVDLELFSKLYLSGLESRLFDADNLFDDYSKEVLLEYMIINNLNSLKPAK
ncbi:TetR/AcrR family transcriptional regulator [Tenacibaculum larymnensis]|uniref:TetR/AcrR family transcriptional regulator n=1 Tax=Tenacibaculum larymnensis TaxID=2878201 RepID=A0A9X4EQG3_9FLAO|nr:TetR/AcrR family transcriptional regulator [Tenacibaculum larymnensis]MDE1206340.1 TetR/AcrR family transcriptional regulator [Tenacibaculum larymnensis]